MEIRRQKIENVFNKFTKKKDIHEAVLLVENISGDFSYEFEYGNKTTETPFLAASITKLFTTTCIFILKEQKKLTLDDKVIKYVDKAMLKQLHTYKGKDYTSDLTLGHLLCHISGLPDVVEEGNHKERKQAVESDRQMSFAETIKLTKQLDAHFEPGKGKRAYYANINFDLLGKVIEKTTNLRLDEVFQRFIFNPLGLENTYMPGDDDFIPKAYLKETSYYFPNTVKSLYASGGCISTAQDLMIFIKAFFGGKLFKNTTFQELEINNKLQAAMGPIHYGAGYMKIPLGGFTTLFMGKGELLGHSGSTGSFAFFYPLSDLYFVGDLNQIENPALPLRLVIQLAMSGRT